MDDKTLIDSLNFKESKVYSESNKHGNYIDEIKRINIETLKESDIQNIIEIHIGINLLTPLTFHRITYMRSSYQLAKQHHYYIILPQITSNINFNLKALKF